MKQKTKRRKRKQLVNVMRVKRAPLMSNFASKEQGFGHSRGK
jgi:hypothetical protein